jgi:hypothetical protein
MGEVMNEKRDWVVFGSNNGRELLFEVSAPVVMTLLWEAWTTMRKGISAESVDGVWLIKVSPFLGDITINRVDQDLAHSLDSSKSVKGER